MVSAVGRVNGSSPSGVTVVMIFLDAATFIEEAIQSVLAQTFEDFELILVDDGSSDASSGIAREYARRFPDRIRYAEHEGHRNRGMSASRNLGVRLGTRPLISFLDSDDIWLPRRLERYVSVLEQHPAAGMAYGPTLYWFSWDPSSGADDPEFQDFEGRMVLPTERLIPSPVPLRLWLQTSGGCLPGMNSLLIRREAFEAIEGFEEEFRALYEDQVFLSKMVINHPVVIVPEVLDHYRQHRASCCYQGIATGDYHPNLLHPARGRYLHWLEAYCRETGLDDRLTRKALRRELLPYRWKVHAVLYTWRRTLPGPLRAAARRWVPEPVRKHFRTLNRIRRQLKLRRDHRVQPG
jgi:glycosyltransferase involved in cell wall biosynthesis